MPRGGKRNGRPGAAYPNRSDLNQPVRTAPGQTYGKATQQAAAQQAVPLPQQAGPPAAPQQAFQAPDPGLLSAPSARPGEPVTAGSPVGPGAGPSPMLGQDDQILANLRAAYAQEPNDGLAQLISRMSASRGPVR